MPSASEEKINKLIRKRLQRTLDSLSSAGFSRAIAKRIQLDTIRVTGVELDGTDGDTKPTRSAQSSVSCLVKVEQDMCNVSGNLHGGCGAWLVDHCSSLALLALSGDGRWETSGVSTNLNLNYLKAAPLGTNLRIVTEVLNFGRVTSLLETKIYNVDTKQLLTVGWHTKQDPQMKPAGKYKL
ncbi:PaaI family thioesterase [Sporobolomyces salmoneus]|uniref:PaaI family thioesterase n=1 Tax=Sporobolomyces salmoneus TaxID=183962 RepID=UPI00317C8615